MAQSGIRRASGGRFWQAWRRSPKPLSRLRTESELLFLLRDSQIVGAERQALEEQLFQLVRERIGSAVDVFCGALVGMERDDLITEVWLKLRKSDSIDLRPACVRLVARQLVQSKLRRRDSQSYRQEASGAEQTDRISLALEQLTDEAPSPLEQLCARDLLHRVRQQLGKENAAPLILNSVYGWEHQEIAAWLGIHEEASKKRAQRAAARLRTLAEDDEGFRLLLKNEKSGTE